MTGQPPGAGGRLSPRSLLAIGTASLLVILAIWHAVPVNVSNSTRLDSWMYRLTPNGAWLPWPMGKTLKPAAPAELWMKTELPEQKALRKALFIPPYTAFQSFEIRLDEQLLYRSGELPAGFRDRHRYLLWHLVDLPDNASGRNLTIRFSSTHPSLIGFVGPVWLAEPSLLQNRLVITGLPVTILAALFMLAGCGSLAATGFFGAVTRRQLTALSQTSLGAGLYLFSESSFCQLLISSPLLISYGHYLSFFLFITGISRYLQQLTSGSLHIRGIWIFRFFTLYPLIATVLDSTGLFSWDASFELALYLVMASAGWYAVLLYSSGFRDAAPQDAAMVRAAFVPLCCAGLHDAAAGLQLIPSGPLLYPWGVLILIGSLFYTLLSREREERLLSQQLLENARLAEETAITDERRRIAREIHDGVAQNLAMLNMRATVWPQLADNDPPKLKQEIALLRTQLQKDIAELRRVIYAIRPLDLDDYGFSESIRRYVTEIGSYSGLRVVLQIEEPIRFHRLLEQELFRIIQESLNNSIHHANASEVTITLCHNENNGITLFISDNGNGFDTTKLHQTPRLGLRQMRERVALRNGTFLITSKPGQGTAITVSFPAANLPTVSG